MTAEKGKKRKEEKVKQSNTPLSLRLGRRSSSKMALVDEEAKRTKGIDAPRLLPLSSIDALLSWQPGSRPEDAFCRASVRLEGGDVRTFLC